MGVFLVNKVRQIYLRLDRWSPFSTKLLVVVVRFMTHCILDCYTAVTAATMIRFTSPAASFQLQPPSTTLIIKARHSRCSKAYWMEDTRSRPFGVIEGVQQQSKQQEASLAYFDAPITAATLANMPFAASIATNANANAAETRPGPTLVRHYGLVAE